MASRESLVIGIDGSKPTRDGAFGADPHAPRETIPSTDEGVQRLVTRLQRLQPTLMVLEATGGLERIDRKSTRLTMDFLCEHCA